ncbi:MAG: biotin--[acetyl-CoA-carboxylase] ligase [Polyangiales bacterium]
MVLEVTGSTNDDARAWANQSAPSGSLVIADTQTKGRGRQGRAWSSPAGHSLSISIICRPTLAPVALPPLAIVAGLAARELVSARMPCIGDAPQPAVQVKWPNDVWIAGRKVGGILVEASIVGSRVEHVVIGLGLNVTSTTFPPEIEGKVTSLLLGGCDSSKLDRTKIILDWIGLLDREISVYLHHPEALPSRLAPHDAIFGRRVRIGDPAQSARVSGTARGIDPDGRMRVVLDDGTVFRASAGEVTMEQDGD